MTEILDELKRRGVFTAVGGPWVTLQRSISANRRRGLHRRSRGDLAEFPPPNGVKAGTPAYEQAEKSDMTNVPSAPLRPPEDAPLPVSAASSSREVARSVRVLRHHRGLRTPPAHQRPSYRFLPNSKAVVAAGEETVFIVDDNLVGNKKAIKVMLRELIAWQEAEAIL